MSKQKPEELLSHTEMEAQTQQRFLLYLLYECMCVCVHVCVFQLDCIQWLSLMINSYFKMSYM